jgi:hypothetical protein
LLAILLAISDRSFFGSSGYHVGGKIGAITAGSIQRYKAKLHLANGLVYPERKHLAFPSLFISEFESRIKNGIVEQASHEQTI